MAENLPQSLAVPGQSGMMARRSVNIEAIRAAAEAQAPPSKYLASIPQDDWHAMPSEERFELLKWYAERELETPQDVQITFPQIGFPTAQSPFFQIPAGGEIKTVRSFSACIVYKVRRRALWWPIGSDPVKGTLPTCSSIGGITPLAAITDEAKRLGAPFNRLCGNCQYNDWNTLPPKMDGTPRRGKACRERCNNFLVFDDYEIPYEFSIPPSSLKVFGKYVSDVEAAAFPGGLSGIDTKFSLVPARSSGGIEYMMLSLEIDKKLDFKQIRHAMSLHAQFRAEMEKRGMVIEADDVDTTQDDPADFDPAKF